MCKYCEFDGYGNANKDFIPLFSKKYKVWNQHTTIDGFIQWGKKRPEIGIASDFMDFSFPVNYCPKCGRDLRKNEVDE